MRTVSVKTQAFEGVFVSLLIIAIFVVTFGTLSLSEPYNPTAVVRNAFECLGERPAGEAIALDGVPTDEELLKGYAVMLYNTGGTSAKNADALAAYSSCIMKMTVLNIDNYVDIDSSIIKTQDEYFRNDYRLEKDLPFKRLLGNEIAAKLEMVLAERVYTDTDMEYLAYQKVRNSERGENDIPTADWSSPEEQERDVPVYNSTQDGIFEVMGYNVTTDAVLSATVEYIESEQGNYYSVSMSLNTAYEPLTERVIGAIRSGSQDANAAFKTITYEFELWDNGYFKSVHIFEYWTAKAMGKIAFATESDYNWQFSYDADDANPDTFADCVAYKKELKIS